MYLIANEIPRSRFSICFHFLKLPVRIEPSFLYYTSLVGLLILFQAGLFKNQKVFLFGLSFLIGYWITIFVHELGHALLMKWFKCNPIIILHTFSGNTIPDELPGQPWKVCLIYLGGSLIGFSFALIIESLLRTIGINQSLFIIQIMISTVLISFVWNTISLLPILPFDGGHILNAFLMYFSRKKSLLYTLAFSFVVWLTYSILSIICLFHLNPDLEELLQRTIIPFGWWSTFLSIYFSLEQFRFLRETRSRIKEIEKYERILAFHQSMLEEERDEDLNAETTGAESFSNREHQKEDH